VLTRIALLATTRSRRVLIVAGLLLLVAVGFALKAPGRLLSAGFVSPSAPSQLASNRLDADFHATPNLTFLVTARHGTVDSGPVAAAGQHLAAALDHDPGVSAVTSYWGTRAEQLRSRDGTKALVLVDVAGTDNQVASRTTTLLDRYSVGPAAGGPVTVQAGNSAAVGNAIGTQIGKDLGLAEGIAVPVTMVLLLLAFGSLVAAALPLITAVCSIFGTLAVLYFVSLFTDVSTYSLNMVTALGLGLGIDSALLIVSRYREELGGGLEPAAAVRRAVETAGRTVMFSAAAIGAALASMLVFPLYFLRSFAYAGLGVVVIGTAAAVIVLPAVLTLLGHRVNAVPIRKRALNRPAESAFWRRTATRVMRRPLVFGLAGVALLLAAGIPFLHVNFGPPDDRALPTSSVARQVDQIVKTQFPTNANNTLDVVTTGPVSSAAAASYSARLSRLPGVTLVNGPAGAFASGDRTGSGIAGQYDSPRGSWFSASIRPDALSSQAAQLVHAARALAPPAGTKTYVGGLAASFVDQKHDLAAPLPLAIGLIAIVTFIVLFLYTGSVVLPVKALVLNALNLSAVLGIMVWIFQDGHLSGLLGFTPAPINTSMPVLLFCLAFGLSMDYEVFLLSRIKELHDEGMSTEESVAGGLARTGRIMSTAAAILAVSFFAFGLSHISFIQLFGIGTAIAILVDAVLVRGVLVPAFMRVAGDYNWWAPAPLRRLHQRIGLSEGPGALAVTAPDAVPLR
jgi:putative drug exporter of the RND superfamily